MRVSIEQLMAAWSLVKKGSRAAGIDGVTVDLFASVLGEQLRSIHGQLQREHYAASPARGFTLPKKSGGHRIIGIPTVQDRIVQRYLLQTIYPQLEQVFQEAAHAYRPGLSIYSAVRRVMVRYRHQPAWVIKADIQQFFDTLSWPLLLGHLEQLGLQPEVMSLIEQQIKSGIVLSG